MTLTTKHLFTPIGSAQDEHADVVRTALTGRHVAHFGNELGEVCGGVCLWARVIRRLDAGGAAQRIDAEPAIVGQCPHIGLVGGQQRSERMCFFARITHESSRVFGYGRHPAERGGRLKRQGPPYFFAVSHSQAGLLCQVKRGDEFAQLADLVSVTRG